MDSSSLVKTIEDPHQTMELMGESSSAIEDLTFYPIHKLANTISRITLIIYILINT